MRLAVAIVSVALLATVDPAAALDVSVGGISASVGSGGVSVSAGSTSASVSTSGGGVSASAGSGGTSAGASLGGGGGGLGGSYASVGGSAGGTSGSASITGNDGSLIGIRQNGGATTAAVNLGSALNGFLTAPNAPLDTVDLNTALDGIGPRNSVAERVRSAFLSQSTARRRMVRLTCAQVFRNPGAFSKETRILCSLIARL